MQKHQVAHDLFDQKIFYLKKRRKYDIDWLKVEQGILNFSLQNNLY